MIMKKFLMLIVSCFAFVAIFTSCINSNTDVEENQKFYACMQETANVFDGMDSIVPLKVAYAVCDKSDTTNQINNLWKTQIDYDYMWNLLVIYCKNECKYPRTYIPKNVLYFTVEDTINENTYLCKSSISGICKNGFGVDCDISSSIKFSLTNDSIGDIIIDVLDIWSY